MGSSKRCDFNCQLWWRKEVIGAIFVTPTLGNINWQILFLAPRKNCPRLSNPGGFFLISQTFVMYYSFPSGKPMMQYSHFNPIHFLTSLLNRFVFSSKSNASSMSEMKKVFEKSIVAACDIPAGQILEERHLAYKKPGDGISAKMFRSVLGKKSLKNISMRGKFSD